MSANGQAALFAFLIALVFGAGFLAALLIDLARPPARHHRHGRRAS